MKMKLFSMASLAFVCLALISTVAKAQWPVRDANGNPVMARRLYELWGVSSRDTQNRGPITKGSRFTGRLNFVINELHSTSHPRAPHPVIFYPFQPRTDEVLVNRDYNIVFESTVAEERFNVWQRNRQDFVATGGVRGNPPARPNCESYFQLALVDDVHHLYKIVFQPQVCTPVTQPINVSSQWVNMEDRLILNRHNSHLMEELLVRLVPHRRIQQVVEGAEYNESMPLV